MNYFSHYIIVVRQWPIDRNCCEKAWSDWVDCKSFKLTSQIVLNVLPIAKSYQFANCLWSMVYLWKLLSKNYKNFVQLQKLETYIAYWDLNSRSWKPYHEISNFFSNFKTVPGFSCTRISKLICDVSFELLQSTQSD